VFIDVLFEAVPSVQCTNECSDDKAADTFERLEDYVWVNT